MPVNSHISRLSSAAMNAVVYVASRDYSSVVKLSGAAAAEAKPRTSHLDPSDGKKECLNIFPSVAVLRQKGNPDQFIDFTISGQAYVLQPASDANSSQRVFLRLARKLAGDPDEGTPQHRRLTERILPFISMALVNRTVQITVYSGESDAHDSINLFSIGVRTDFDGLIAPQRIKIVCSEIDVIPTKIRIESHLVPLSVVSDMPTAVDTPITKGNTVCMNVGNEFALRVITDVDDTCKRSDVTLGLRSIIKSVFTRSNRQLAIPDMSRWYNQMIGQGIDSFHYCTNSPFELYPALSKFLQIANLPEGQILLKHYGIGIKLFQELRKDPGVRKRDNLLSIINSHPHSKFILIGDSGERDLELYISIAQQSDQIVGIFIRNISDRDGPEVWPEDDSVDSKILPYLEHTLSMTDIKDDDRGNFTEDPESIIFPGNKSNSEQNTSLSEGVRNVPRRTLSSPDKNSVDVDDFDIISNSTQDYDEIRTKKEDMLEEFQKRREDWAVRVKLATSQCPSHIFFRCFKDPQECAQDTNILTKMYKDELQI